MAASYHRAGLVVLHRTRVAPASPGGKMRLVKGLAHGLARTVRWLWSRLVTGYLRVRGVDVGRSCSFYGIPRARRVRGSSISIGDRCVVRSASGSNQFSRGLPTVLSTVARDAAIIIDEHVGISDSVIVCASRVHIGSETLLGVETLITDTDGHPVCPECRAARGDAGVREVRIGRGCFVAARSVVLKGVILADGTCVGAGSVVTQSGGETGGVLAGAPATMVRSSARCEGHRATGENERLDQHA